MLRAILVVFFGCATEGETGMAGGIVADGGPCVEVDSSKYTQWTGPVEDGVPLIMITSPDGTSGPPRGWRTLQGNLEVICQEATGYTASVRWIR